MRILHSLKDSIVGVFESCKAKLKGECKDGSWFLPLRLYILPNLGCIPISDNYTNRET